MKAKRILATILSVALIATSSNFTLDAYATGDGNDAPVVGTEQPGSESDKNSPGDNLGDGNDATGSVETGGDKSSDTNLTVENGTNDGDDRIVAENDFFGVTESGKLCAKPDKPIDSLAGVVALPKEAKRIPAGIFTNNTKITALTIPEDSLLEVIDEGAFKGSAISVLSLPDAVTEIKKETFKNSKLTTITFKSTSKLVSIGEEAFFGCGLEKMDIPVSVIRIEDGAFNNCRKLTQISLHNVESVGNSAFLGCVQLKSIGWGEKLKKIGDYAFSGIGITTVDLTLIVGVTAEGWGTSVFENCASLTKVTFASDMTVIPAGMFKDCAKISAITIPRDCTAIREDAFSGCNAIKKVTIPDRVRVIESGAFANCGLTEVTINQRGSNAAGDSDIKLADGAFNQTSLTMKGYDGTVEDYAIKKGYKFKSLHASYKITLSYGSDADPKRGTATLSKKTAKEGEVVEVTVTPAAEYRLRSYGFTYNGNPITTLKGTKAEGQVFSFVMPDEDVKVTVPFERTTLAYASLQYEFEQTDPHISYDWNSKTKRLSFDKSGMSCKLVIEGKRGSTYHELSAWAFEYGSSKSTVATVDSQGIIYARGKGTATITATLKEDTTKKVSFTVRVEEEAVIDRVEIEFADLEKAKEITELIEEPDKPAGTKKAYKVIQYTQSNLSTKEQSFTVNIKAMEANDTANLNVHSEWKSANEELVYVDKEAVDNNTNVIRVKQGVVGETSVKVTVTNGKTGKSKQVLHEESIIVRIIDATPRLIQSTLTVNSNCDLGTGMAFDLLSVYGYEADLSNLSVKQLVIKKSGTKKYEDWVNLDYVEIRLHDGRPVIELTPQGKTFLEGKSSKTYSNAYITGKYTYLSDGGVQETEEFHTPIKSLVLTTKVLKPTIKLSGKINLFFNSKADASDQGEVTITQSLKTLKVDSYRLVSEANYKNPNSENPDPLAHNFTVSAGGVITRSDNEELMKDAKGNAVTKGYLEIKYEGYAPCYVKIAIPTKNTKPAYVLSKTKATVNAYSRNYKLELQLLDKKTKKPISLANLEKLSFDQSASGTTMNLFKDFENSDEQEARVSDKIGLEILDAQKGKAVINVEMDTWNEPMKFTFNLSVNSSAPKAKLKKTTLTLNNLCVGKEESTDVTLNQADVSILSMENIQFVGKDSLASDAEKIRPNIAYSAEDGKLTVSADSMVQAGSYKFSMTPNVQYTDGQTGNIKNVTVTVKVIAKNLTATVKPASVTLNDRFRGYETSVTSYTIKNMPAGNGAVKIQSSGVNVEGVSTAAQNERSAFVFDFDEDATKIRVSQSQTRSVRNGSYKYKISGLKTVIGNEEVDIQPFNVTVKVINKTANLTVKSSGTLNPISGSGIVYTLKPGNTSAKITDVTVKELNKVGGKNDLVDLTNFRIGEIKMDEDGGIISVQILPDDMATLNAGTHKLRIAVKLEGMNENALVWSKELALKPKHTLPKVKTDVTSTTLYAGVAANSPKRSQEIRLTKTTEKAAVMKDVVLSDSNPKELKNAFKVMNFDPVTQTATVTLIRPDLLIADTEYTLKLEARYENQMNKSKGSAFTLKVKVVN